MTGFSSIFGFALDLESARSLVQDALDIELSSHDSLYRGGEYFFLKHPDFEIILQRNYDLLDGELAEPEYPDTRTLLYLDGGGRAEEIAKILSTRVPGIVLLRRVRN